MPRIHPILCAVLCLLMFTGCASNPDMDGVGRSLGKGGGVSLQRDATVFGGSAFNCTSPAVFDFDKVKAVTPEWRIIVQDGVRPGSGRYRLLVDRMHVTLREMVRRAALAHGHDLVVRDGDIRSANGLEVADLTAVLLQQ